MSLIKTKLESIILQKLDTDLTPITDDCGYRWIVETPAGPYRFTLNIRRNGKYKLQQIPKFWMHIMGRFEDATRADNHFGCRLNGRNVKHSKFNAQYFAHDEPDLLACIREHLTLIENISFI